MEFRVLGSLEVHDDAGVVTLTGAKPRALLAVLLLHANEPVSADRLAIALWGDDAPAGAAKTIQVHVSRLRRALGQPGLLATTAGGYRLRVLPGELDADRFEQLAAEGRRALRDGAPERAARALREALSLWRGPALADVAFEAFARAEIERLTEERLAALEARVEADLALGRHAELAGELSQLVAEHPLRERLHGQLMLALYRSGRQADALEAYRGARRVLVDELGIEPSPELRELEEAILRHDTAVQAPAPSPRASGSRTGRVPAPLTRTVGRERELRELVEWFGRDDVRLVTLTGPGGVGKTRLSIEVARALESNFGDGVWFVSLAATEQPAHVGSTVAQALGTTPDGGEAPGDAVRRFLAPKGALVVLDNFEHLLSGAAIVTDLLGGCPGLKLLTTSREPLRVEPEHRFAVGPLVVPVDARRAAVEEAAASALFVQRARRHNAGFALTEENASAIAQICRRLDGLPLAIELAAARTPLLAPEELSRRLARSLDALGPGARDVPARQRTLRATIEWSYRLLAPEEARTFTRFAVFAGGATVDAAELVTGGDLDALEGLVEKHLLERHHDAACGSRLTMLDTVREYARERLDADEDAPEVHRRHCRHLLAFVESAEPALSTGAEREWLTRLDAELDNVRAALDWSRRHGEATLGLRMAGLLAEFWDIRGLSAEGLQWLEAALETAGDDAPVDDRARACRAQAKLLEEQGSLYDAELRERGRACVTEALALSRQTGDHAAIADALLLLGHLEAPESFPQRQRHALAQEALAHARRATDPRLVADALKDVATALAPAEGGTELEQAIAALRQIGAARSLAMLYNTAAYGAIKAGSLQRARDFLDQSKSLARELDDQMLLAAVFGNAGLAALFAGELDKARNAFEQQLQICRGLVIPWLASEGLAGLAAIATRHGKPDRAAQILGAAAAHGPIGDPDVIARLEHEFFAPARQRHGDGPWRQAHTAGAELAFIDAIDLALDVTAILPGATRANDSRKR
jgi:predicted ATPase/DNA-binding SARP family transcriptional activator